jgi:hypothetical protein
MFTKRKTCAEKGHEWFEPYDKDDVTIEVCSRCFAVRHLDKKLKKTNENDTIHRH